MNIRETIEIANHSIEAFFSVIPHSKKINGTWRNMTCREFSELIENLYCKKNPRTIACITSLKSLSEVDLGTITKKAKEIQ